MFAKKFKRLLKRNMFICLKKNTTQYRDWSEYSTRVQCSTQMQCGTRVQYSIKRRYSTWVQHKMQVEQDWRTGGDKELKIHDLVMLCSRKEFT